MEHISQLELWLSSQAWKTISDEAQRAFPNETGGLLIGYWSAADKVAVVTTCTGPGPYAVHAEASFQPDSEYQQRELSRYYQRSGGYWTYLGDWHSHPAGETALSPLDCHTLRTIAQSKEARCRRPIMLIVESKTAKIGAWCAQTSGWWSRALLIQEMSIVTYTPDR